MTFAYLLSDQGRLPVALRREARRERPLGLATVAQKSKETPAPFVVPKVAASDFTEAVSIHEPPRARLIEAKRARDTATLRVIGYGALASWFAATRASPADSVAWRYKDRSVASRWRAERAAGVLRDEAQRARNAVAIAFIDELLKEAEEGIDEEARREWEEMKASIDSHRSSPRRLFP